MRRRLVPLLAGLAAAALAVPLAAVPAGASPEPSPRYYLALGDSLAYGYQNDLVAVDLAADGDIDPANYRGYVDLVAPSLAGLAGGGAGLTTVNLSCPGQRAATAVPTVSALDQPCGFALLHGPASLHTPYPAGVTAQRQAALGWLQANGARTSVVSVSLGSNDLRDVLGRCQAAQAADPTRDFGLCIQQGVGVVLLHLTTFVAQVRALAPSATVVVFDFYNAYEHALPLTEQLIGQVNASLRGAMALVPGSGVRIAGARAVLNEATPTEQAFHALVGMDQLDAAGQGDIHPTDAGYAALARALRTAVRR